MTKDKNERIVDLEKKCKEYQQCNDARKVEQRNRERFTQMLLKEGRTTKEELSKYFPRKHHKKEV